MIIKIAKFEHIGKFSALTQEKDFQYGENQNCNIVFGPNGSGKTTLSNVISFFADNSFISEEEKTAIFEDIKNNEAANIELKLQDGNKCKYPANQHNKSIYVFNSNFVATHVFDGTKGRLKKFLNATGEIKNEAIEEANKKIAELEADKKKAEGENKDLDNLLKIVNNTQSFNFKNTLTGKRLRIPDLLKDPLPSETIDELQDKRVSLSDDYNLSKNQKDLLDDLITFEQLVFQKIPFNLYNINTILNKNIKQLSKEVLGNKIKEVKGLFADEEYKQSTEKWFRFGKSVLDSSKERGGETKCPICDTDISDQLDDILQNFNGYFDKGYESFIAELKTCKTNVQIAIELVDKCVIDACILGQLWEKYKTQIAGQTFSAFDFNGIKSELETILKACDSKLADIQFTFLISQPVIVALSGMNTAIEGFAFLKNSLQTALSAKKLDSGKIEDKIRVTYKKITLLKFDQFDKGGNIAKYALNQKRIAIISTTDATNVEGLLFYQNKRREEFQKIKTESKSISKFLKIMGINHFIVDINEDAPEENIVIKYNSCGIDKNKLRNCLSEGEKTALAFAYFLSKFENERDTEEKRKESVVVIDDPISSLDENRLYSTAHLMHDNFKTVRQLIVLSHNFLFLKFFNATYGHTNCLFINGDKLMDLPEELKNFESPYFYMLKNVIEFADGTISDTYQNAKKYLPNYIRRVLETFLSFKFAKVVNKSNGNRSPGLNEFKTNISDLVMEDAVKQNLKQKIDNITKITDQHSHGNAQLTEENFYISEDELKTLAQNAVTMIDIMDGVHKSNIIKITNH